MIAGNMGAWQTITAGGKQIEEVESFCCLGSMIDNKSSCDRDKYTTGKSECIIHQTSQHLAAQIAKHCDKDKAV